MTTYPAPVPKPANAGTPLMAIVNTKLAYANIRNGPGTNYRDVGDVRNLTLAAYYPKAVSQNGWVWIEQSGVGGWISRSVVTLEDVNAGVPLGQPATPYKGAVALWHWKGDSVAENTIEELARTIKANAPAVTQVWVKTSDFTPTAGAQWMGYWDTKRNLAIDGPASIDRWASVLAQFGLELHLWAVPRGGNPDAEANLIIQASQRPGVKSMILDVEPYDGFWIGGQAGIRPLMTRIRRALPGAFHIGLCVDPRAHHYETIFPREWQPFVNSIHPMVYWETMRQQPDEVLTETYEVWGNYGKPIIPALQGDAETLDMTTARTLSVARHGAQGLSWWRAGVIGPVEWQVVNKPISIVDTPPPTPTETYGEEIIVRPREAGFNFFSYTGQDEFQEFQGTYGWPVLYKSTSATVASAAARWAPRLSESGKYEISVMVPARHATTRNARYRVYGVKGSSSDIIVSLDQSLNSNQWVTLGVFDLDKAAINGGTVFLNDLTGEGDRTVTFDAVRWRRVIQLPGTPQPPPIEVPAGYADGYDQPMGPATERASAQVWAGKWLDASPFGQLYFIGTPSEAYHTGADLNLPSDADAHSPVYAAASGVVTFAARLPIWGNMVIIKHDPLATTGLVMWSRSAHVESIMVQVGDRVKRGQQIAKVGNAYGRYAYHLHFDLSPTTILEQKPEHWPGRNRAELLKHYVDPRDFIAGHRPRR